ncbi:MAG: PQQ-binding-like beta-propeller repeat protein [Chthoniobacter sp.]|nr:PQQ-binding-like beta-propeller repeat protein [Chthoniobacter sp.]
MKTTLTLLTALLFALRAALHAAEADDWPTYNHDVLGWRFNPAEKTLSPANVGRLVEKWRFPAADSKETIGVVHATPAVVDGEVYFGTGTFPAFYKLGADGMLKWVYRNPARKAVLPPAPDGVLGDKLGSTIKNGGIMSSALVAEGAVFFADTGGWVYCLNAATGAERWKVDMRAPPFPGAHPGNLTLCSPILADGKIIIGGGTMEQMYAGTPAYPGSTGRGFVVAFDAKTGAVIWKYDVGEKPRQFDQPLTVPNDWGTTTYTHGPATSSVWCTPSYDAETKSIFFGTDVNTAPRQPTPDNPKFYTEDSDAIMCLDVTSGLRKWSTQIYPGDQWNNAMRGWDSKTGLYKDCSIGDTPKIFTIELDGRPVKVVGAGCKNGGFYLLRADDGKLVKHTPIYTGPPIEPPAPHDPRVLAFPSPIGGLQTGCATDGKTIFTNGIDAVRLTTQETAFAPGQVPTGGRVTATSTDLTIERWRHERTKVSVTAGPPEKPVKYERGDVVGSGIAVGNGVAYFTAAGSEKLVALDIATGKSLREIEIGPVFCGPSLSRGRVYVGSGNTVFTGGASERNKAASIEKRTGGLFPLQNIGCVRCFGLPEEDKTAEAQSSPTQSSRESL